MKSGFFDPIGSKKDSIPNKSVWNFEAPEYDKRSSNFVNAGDHYGVGHRQPVGHQGEAAAEAKCLPRGRVNTMKVDEKG